MAAGPAEAARGFCVISGSRKILSSLEFSAYHRCDSVAIAKDVLWDGGCYETADKSQVYTKKKITMFVKNNDMIRVFLSIRAIIRSSAP